MVISGRNETDTKAPQQGFHQAGKLCQAAFSDAQNIGSGVEENQGQGNGWQRTMRLKAASLQESPRVSAMALRSFAPFG